MKLQTYIHKTALVIAVEEENLDIVGLLLSNPRINVLIKSILISQNLYNFHILLFHFISHKRL